MQQGTAQTQHRLQYLGAERPYAAFQRDQVKKKEEEDSVLDDDNPWSLPINHQITQSLDTTGLIQASLDTAIPETNVGYKLLQKMGWKSGTGLGKNGTGRVEPIRAELKEDFLGVGKKEEEEHFAEVATAKRKALDVEKDESELVKKQKAEQAAKQERIEQTVAEQNRPFYCSLCNKQYTNVTQYDTHLSSYDHHHKKRLIEMKQAQRNLKKGGKTKKIKKEDKRELERLKKIQEEAARRESPAIISSPVGGFRPITGESSGFATVETNEQGGFKPVDAPETSSKLSFGFSGIKPPSVRPPPPPPSAQPLPPPPQPPVPMPPLPPEPSTESGASVGQPPVSFGFSTKANEKGRTPIKFAFGTQK